MTAQQSKIPSKKSSAINGDSISALALIPARGGSTRIPRKNIRLFLDKPMISYSIRAAKDSGCFGTIMVSTEDREIAEMAKGFGAELPFLRSPENANDIAGLADVAVEVIRKYESLGLTFRHFCCILPTAPFISGPMIRNTYELLIKSDADSLVPVVRFGYPIQRALYLTNNKAQMVWPENYEKRSQDFPPTYHDCGQFYWLRTDRFLEHRKFFTGNTVAIEIPESQVQDIDTEEDWKVAESKYMAMVK